MSLAKAATASIIQSRNPEPGNSAAYAVPPVERAFKLLRHIAAGDSVGNMSVTARALGLSRTTLMRLIATLEAERIIERRTDGPCYSLGLGLIGLAGQALYSNDLVQTGDAIIASLCEQLSLSSHIGVLDGTDVLYVARRTPNLHLVSNVRIGSRLPAHATTMGRIMLAHLAVQEVETLYANVALKKYTGKTPANISALIEQCCVDKKSGSAWSDSNFEIGIASVAAAIFDRHGKVVGAVNVTGPSAHFASYPKRQIEVENAVLNAASMISSRLGFTTPQAIKNSIMSVEEVR